MPPPGAGDGGAGLLSPRTAGCLSPPRLAGGKGSRKKPRWSPNEVSSHAFKKQLFYQYRYIKTLKAEKKKNPLEVSNSK